jgi:hypothetical protein
MTSIAFRRNSSVRTAAGFALSLGLAGLSAPAFAECSAIPARATAPPSRAAARA